MQRVFVLLLAAGLTVPGGCSGNDRNAIEASGTIEGTNINIGSEVAGKVKEVWVMEGTRVSAGDTLVVIDDTDYQIQLRQALANAAAADAQYRLALEGSRKEDILQAEAAYKTSRTDYERMKELLAAQTITQKQYDDVYARFVSAEQTYQKLVRGLRKPEIEIARARREQAEAQADQLRKKVRDCSIVAPAEGTVTLKSVEVGELVTPGANVIRLTYLDIVKIVIYVNEQYLPHIRLGQKAEVKIDGMPDRTFEGKVTFISPSAEFTPKNVQTKEERTKLVFGVKIEVENKDGALKPGLPADARLVIGQ
ncbi:MAG: efflux RND transporter periplasmic adaptor subunit [Bacteroidetes bacterium]|nr:efflux RND transporter periplasmic adaptor subunit [Bacteroidota bacterium]MCW5895256.1 efflux RND transporter periplasmic adaptor subunit [Bacteroidota bacterium]